MKKIFWLFIVCVIVTSYTFAQKKNVDKAKITIKNLGKEINSSFSDFAPVISADGSTMIFTSRRPVTEKEIAKHKQSMEHVYISQYNEKKKKWSPAVLLSENINVQGRNNSALAISNDGQRILIYRDDENGNGDIWESVLNGKDWAEPEKLSEPINSKKHESSASYSPDGRRIYFVSNRDNGKGGKDIWYCTQDDDGKWGRLENLGESINTKEDEEGVFIHPDGKTLYFSSKGHNSIGNYDIFKSVLENEKWSSPQSLGSPLNTIGDDAFIVYTADGVQGYYASNRTGGMGEEDIYLVKPITTKKENAPKLTLFKGVVIDKETQDSLESDIEIIDNEKNTTVSKIKSNSSTGKFLISLPSGKNYGINVKKNGYLFYSDNLTIPDTSAYKEIIKTVQLEKIKAGHKIVLKNIFYDFGKSTLKDESKSELEQLVKLMNENVTSKIEISSHTDNKGADEFNLKLSQVRAQSVVDYLISKGVNKDRLVAKGYGESQPIAEDTDEGRQINRRTEFKILND
jgi:outer membrane protein OmpA-like peptidoglycan-associated protein/Tol biopolymer transport system component